VRTHGRKMGEIIPGVPPKGARMCFVFFLFSMQRGLSAIYPAPISTICGFCYDIIYSILLGVVVYGSED